MYEQMSKIVTLYDHNYTKSTITLGRNGFKIDNWKDNTGYHDTTRVFYNDMLNVGIIQKKSKAQYNVEHYLFGISCYTMDRPNDVSYPEVRFKNYNEALEVHTFLMEQLAIISAKKDEMLGIN